MRAVDQLLGVTPQPPGVPATETEADADEQAGERVARQGAGDQGGAADDDGRDQGEAIAARDGAPLSVEGHDQSFGF